MTEFRRTGAAGSAGPALARCIAIPAERFAAEHWGRAPLMTPAAQLPRAFDDLIDASAVDELVSTRGLRTPFLRIAKDGSVLASRSFTASGGAGATIADQVVDDRVLAHLAGGATLVLQALHRTWPPLVEFGTALAAELGHPVQINAYVTPPQSRGFASHYDVHDVFVLQVAGRKRWRIHAPVVSDPLEDDTWEHSKLEVAARADGEPLLDVVLEPGDAVYLPRGTIHAAEALGETSIHLTVGVHPVTRFHIVRALLQLAATEPELRRSLPMGLDLADPQVLQPELAATAQALRDWLQRAPIDAVAGRLGDHLLSQTRPQPISPLAQLATASAVGAHDRLRLRGGLRARATDGPERTVLVTASGSVSVPAAAAQAVKAILTGEPFTAAELPGLTEDEQLSLVRRLLREGIVVAAPAPPSA